MRFSAFTWLGRRLTDTVTPAGRLRPNLHRLDVPRRLILAVYRSISTLHAMKMEL